VTAIPGPRIKVRPVTGVGKGGPAWRWFAPCGCTTVGHWPDPGRAADAAHRHWAVCKDSKLWRMLWRSIRGLHEEGEIH